MRWDAMEINVSSDWWISQEVIVKPWLGIGQTFGFPWTAPVAEQKKTRKTAFDLATVTLGGIRADRLWEEYAQSAPATKTLRQRRYNYASFCRWFSESGEVLDGGTLDRYASAILNRGRKPSGVAVVISHIRKVLTVSFPAEVAPKKRRAKKPSKPAVHRTLSHLDPRRCLPYLPEEVKKKSKRRYSRKWVLEFLELSRNFTDSELKTAIKKKLFYNHPDMGGDGLLISPLSELLNAVTPREIYGQMINTADIFRGYLVLNQDHAFFDSLCQNLFRASIGRI